MSRPSPSPTGAPARSRAGNEPSSSAPLGIKVICVFGWFVSILGLFPTLALVGAGGGASVVGLVFFALTFAQMYVLYGLWTLRGWAWTWTMIIYAIGLLGDVVTANLLGLIVGLVLIAYVYSKRDYYR